MKPSDERTLSLPYSEEDQQGQTMTTIASRAMAAKSAWYPDARTPFAELIMGAPASLLGVGGRDGPSTAASTVIASFCPPSTQCLPISQIYHFLPGVKSGISSFPVARDSFAGGTMQSWKAVPFTLKTFVTSHRIVENCQKKKEKKVQLGRNKLMRD